MWTAGNRSPIAVRLRAPIVVMILAATAVPIEWRSAVFATVTYSNDVGDFLANIGGYMFPKSVFDLTLPLSPRGEYEITDAVSQLAATGSYQVVEAKYWLPIGTIAQWEAAQGADVRSVRG